MPVNKYKVTVSPVSKSDAAASVAPIIDDEKDYKPVYYDLNGIEVNSGNIKKGIYIMRTGSKVEKVIIR